MLRYSRRALLGSGAAAMGAVLIDGVACARESADAEYDHVRAFVGSSRVALGGAGAAAGAQIDDGDPIDAHLLREATRHAKTILSQDALHRHEAVVGMASNLRLHAAHVRSKGLDARLASTVRRHSRGGDRDALLDSAVGPDAAMRHHDRLKALGLEGLHVAERDIPREHYDRMITTLSSPGALPTLLDQAADAFEAVGAQMARFNGVGRPDAPHVRPAALQDIGGWCSTMNTVCAFMREAAAIICVIAGIQPEFAPICGVMGLEAATACFFSWLCGNAFW